MTDRDKEIIRKMLDDITVSVNEAMAHGLLGVYRYIEKKEKEYAKDNSIVDVIS